MIVSIAIATHVLVNFNVDDSVCAVPVGKITRPPTEQLKCGVQCTVQWASEVVYEGKILCVGMVKICMLASLFIVLVGVIQEIEQLLKLQKRRLYAKRSNQLDHVMMMLPRLPTNHPQGSEKVKMMPKKRRLTTRYV